MFCDCDLQPAKYLYAFGDWKCKTSFPRGSEQILLTILEKVFNWFTLRRPSPLAILAQSCSKGFLSVILLLKQWEGLSEPDRAHSLFSPIHKMDLNDCKNLSISWQLFGLSKIYHQLTVSDFPWKRYCHLNFSLANITFRFKVKVPFTVIRICIKSVIFLFYLINAIFNFKFSFF